MKKLFLTVIASLLFVSLFAGDILTLTNNKVFYGKVKKIKNCEIVFKAQHKKYYVPVDSIFSIQFKDVNDPIYVDYLESLKSDTNKCLLGQLDAEIYHGKKAGHFALGFLFGPFAMIGTALSNPTPQKSTKTLLSSKNKALFDDLEYLSCYKKKAKNDLLLWETAGCCSYGLLFLLFL